MFPRLFAYISPLYPGLMIGFLAAGSLSSLCAQNEIPLSAQPAGLLKFKAEKGVFYQLQKQTSPAGGWSSVGVPIKGSGNSIEHFLHTVPDKNKTSYRLRTLNKQWVMVWHDEFNGNQLDTSKWAREENGYGGGNNEKQFYSTNTKYCHTKDGTLRISVYRDPHTTVDGKTQPYTSARIRTLHRAKWQYGRFEVRAKMPNGQGIWPAVWMLPTQSPYGGWASCGEIDILESRGNDVGKIVGALHFGGPWPRNTHISSEYPFPQANSFEEFHTYTMEWNKDQISWAVDGITYQTIKKEQWHSEKAPKNPYAPFNHPFHLIINVAVDGGFFKGTHQKSDLISDNAFPQTLQVDYIRVYQWAGQTP